MYNSFIVPLEVECNKEVNIENLFFFRERYEYPIYRRATWTCNPNPNNLTFSVSLSVHTYIMMMMIAHSSDFFIFHRDDLLITACRREN